MTEENIVEPKIRVLVVDDSAIMRRIITTALKMDPVIEVVGIAEDGLISLDKVRELSPDVITMDIEMPNMDGLTMLQHIRADPALANSDPFGAGWFFKVRASQPQALEALMDEAAYAAFKG